MNYYERHLGDYAKDTAHLSMLEHGAYTLLLDRYYGTEQPIPTDQAYRVARAHSKEEKAAVDSVLREFFVLNETQWVNCRCEEEIAKAQKRITAARTNGVSGGRPKRNPEQTQQKPDGLLLGSISETQTKALQSPDSNLHTPDTREEPTPLPPSVAEPEVRSHSRAQSLAIARATTGLDVTAFDRWIEYRKQRKPALKPMSIEAVAADLAKHGNAQAAIVQQSIANGWQGLFPLKTNGSSTHESQSVRPTRYDELAAATRSG